MQKETKQYYGKDIIVYVYTFEESQQNEVILDEVIHFGAAFDVLKRGAFRLPEGREVKQFVGYGQKEEGGDRFIAIMDGLSIKQAANIMLDLGCIDIVIQEAELHLDIPEEEEETTVQYVSPGPTVGYIAAEDIEELKDEDTKKKK